MGSAAIDEAHKEVMWTSPLSGCSKHGGAFMADTVDARRGRQKDDPERVCASSPGQISQAQLDKMVRCLRTMAWSVCVSWLLGGCK